MVNYWHGPRVAMETFGVVSMTINADRVGEWYLKFAAYKWDSISIFYFKWQFKLFSTSFWEIVAAKKCHEKLCSKFLISIYFDPTWTTQ